MTFKALKWAAFGVATTLLAACGNDGSATRGADAVKDLARVAVAQIGKSDAPAAVAPDPVALISKTLSAVPDQPLQFVLLEKTGAFSAASISGVNGTHITWLTPNRRSMTLDRGMLVATRGFGADILSVEDTGAAGLISRRHEGKATKVYRYLTKSEKVNRLEVTCRIERGAASQVDSGVISAQTVLMTEHCTGANGFEITNSYWVDSAGRTIQSVQWVSAASGKIVLRKLRH